MASDAFVCSRSRSRAVSVRRAPATEAMASPLVRPAIRPTATRAFHRVRRSARAQSHAGAQCPRSTPSRYETDSGTSGWPPRVRWRVLAPPGGEDAAMERAELAAMIDHTLLKPEATVAEVEALCEEATDLGVAAVCVSPSHLPITDGLGVGIDVATVIGFPSGAHQPTVKAHEAEVAVDAGATELDMVVNLGLVTAGEWLAVGD